MLVLITYDVNTSSSGGSKRLRKVAKICQDFGRRVQNSVFECVISEDQVIFLKNALESVIDKQNDSIRFYYLGNNYIRKVDHIGKQTAIDLTAELIF